MFPFRVRFEDAFATHSVCFVFSSWHEHALSSVERHQLASLRGTHLMSMRAEIGKSLQAFSCTDLSGPTEASTCSRSLDDLGSDFGQILGRLLEDLFEDF